MDFDYLIVGGGAAGCVLAARLSEDPDVDVALIESGPPDRSALIHCPAGIALIARTRTAARAYQTVPQPGLLGRRGHQPRGHVLGGSTSINAMCYARGRPGDFDAWADMGNAGWGWQDVRPYFLRAENNHRWHDDWHGRDGPLDVADLQSPNPFSMRFIQAAQQAGFPRNHDFNGARQEGVGLYQVMQRAGERCSAAKAYLTPHLRRPNLHVMTDTRVRRLVLQPDGGARQLEIERGGQVSLLACRREIILSAGTFESPAILMRSGIGPGEHLQQLGIATRRDLPGVGANLHDHPDAVLVAQAPGQHDLIGTSLQGAWRLLRGVRDWRRHRRGLLTTNFAEAGGFIKTDPQLAEPDIQLHFVVAQLVDHGRRATLGHGFSLHACLLQPRSRGRLRLADSHPYAEPLIDPQFLADPLDLQQLRAGLRCAQRILAQPALRAFGQEAPATRALHDDAAFDQWIRANADTIYHPVGTCRMGADPMAVVDSQLRVHGVPGLRVVDASVMPRIVSGNTTAPTVMIAEKAVDLLRGRVPQDVAPAHETA